MVCPGDPAAAAPARGRRPLFAYFLRRPGKRPRRDCAITERALAALQAWRWPGNVRELENEAARLVALHGQEPVIRRRHLGWEIQTSNGPRLAADDLGTLRELGQAQEILERYLIRKAIAATEGRKAAAARRLGLSRQGLYKKIARYGMTDLIAGGDARAAEGEPRWGLLDTAAATYFAGHARTPALCSAA